MNADNIPPSVDPSGFPARRMLAFAKAIVDATREVAAAYKPNFAFWASEGAKGISVLGELIGYIHKFSPAIAVILDGKWADIGKTNNGTVQMITNLGADAVTLNPYLGEEALRPFLDLPDIGTFTLCHTSNSGSKEFQEMEVLLNIWEAEAFREKRVALISAQKRQPAAQKTLGPDLFFVEFYKLLALRVANKWQSVQPRGLVVGATFPAPIEDVRIIAGDDTPLLIPGVGTQGGDLEAAVKAAKGKSGEGRFLINVSSAIAGASKEIDFAEAAGKKTLELHEQIQAALKN